MLDDRVLPVQLDGANVRRRFVDCRIRLVFPVGHGC